MTSIRRPTRLSTIAALAAVVAAAPTHLHAQSIADRVNGAPDGRVQFSFAARSGVCGDGRTFIQTGPNNYNGIYYGNSDYARAACVAGPVRVVIDRADRQPLSIQTYVGPADSTLRGVTDLGRVRAQDASDYLLSLATKVDGRAGRDALLPAMLADSVNTAPTLVAIAKNTSLPRETRRLALSYMGRSTDGMQTISANVTDPILAIARDETDNQSVRQSALGVLGRLDHGAGIQPLMQLAEQPQNLWLSKEAMQALARSGDPRARQFLRTAVKRTDLPDDVLTVALRALGQDYATAQDAALLREVYPTLRVGPLTRSGVLGARRDGRRGEHALAHVARVERRHADPNAAARARVGEPFRRADRRSDQALRHDDRSKHERRVDRRVHSKRRAGGDRQAADDPQGRRKPVGEAARDLAALAVGGSEDQAGAAGYSDEIGVGRGTWDVRERGAEASRSLFCSSFPGRGRERIMCGLSHSWFLPPPLTSPSLRPRHD